MIVIFNAVMPVILLLVLGNVLRRNHFVNDSFWRMSDRLTYFVLFPALLISKIASVDASQFAFGQIVVFLAVYFFMVSCLVFYIYRYFGGNKGQFSSLYQGLIRFNSYVYFAIIAAVWDEEVLGLSALLAALVIPLVNVFCVASFAIDGQSFSLRHTLHNVSKNPLIIASVVGLTINQAPMAMPTVLYNTLSILASAALPLALLSIGAAVRVKTLFRHSENFNLNILYLSALTRLLLIPTLAYILATLIGLNDVLRNITVLFAAVPTATSSYILSVQLGGDEEMMTTIISAQTILSVLTLMFWLYLLQSVT